MKKPIDPSLNSNDSEELLFGTGDEPKKEQPPTASLKQQSNELNTDIKEIIECEPSEHQHHHHHHHHHSSSEHHHSSGEHHHSHSSSSHSSHHHSHHSHHKHKRSKRKKMNKGLKVFLSILLVIALLISATGGIYAYLRAQGKTDFTSAVINDNQHDEIITYNGHKYAFNENVVSIAFMGVDQRDLLNKDNAEFVGCADADVVVAVDTSDGTVKVINIPRDTMVDIDVYNDTGVFLSTERVQLCLAYAYGDGKKKSCENVTKAISRILYNVPINKYLALDLEGVAPINDAIGGVTLTATYSIPDKGIIEGQTVTLKGDMAEAYVRTRDWDYLEASLNRSDRIVQYVKAFAAQLIPAVKKDFGVITDLYNTATKYSQTNITLNNATYLASYVLSQGIESFDVYTIKGTMTESKTSPYPDAVIAEFTPDEESVMEAVLNTYYTQLD